MKILERTFECKRGTLTIRGKEYRQDGENLPVVVISHGFLANYKSVSHYAKQFAVWGYAAYCFDFIGGSPRAKSDGSMMEMSVLTEKEDLKAVIAYARGLPYVNTDKLVLMGCSQGGFVSALTAAELKEQVSKLILFYPALCIPDDARKGQMMMFSFDPEHIPDTLQKGFLRLGSCYPKSVIDMDPMKEITPYSGPVLIVHGERDDIVNVSYAKQAWKAYQNARMSGSTTEDRPRPGVQLLLIEKGRHGFDKRADCVALEGVRQFLHGRTEVLHVDVALTGREMTRSGKRTQIRLPFEGIADGPYFKGNILPGAADVQERIGKKPVCFTADYTIEGTDYTGAPCQVHVVNQTFDGKNWKPTVTTDSEALGFLNDAVCSAHLEHRKKGPVVRIYTHVI